MVCWVSESMQPFNIVEDWGFRVLMKTGRPGYYLPSRFTVSRDVKEVFVNVRKRIAQMLQASWWHVLDMIRTHTVTAGDQEHDGKLSFGTDAWTSPNLKAYITVTVHLEQNGVPLSLLLDLVEVAKSHSGSNLAVAFAKILKDFGIVSKVSKIM
jgi:hypothetical protein